MIEIEVFEKLAKSIKNGIPVALVSVLDHEGSTPGKQGSIMAVLKSGETCGTVGGGSLEFAVVTQAIKCIVDSVSREFSYDLSEGGTVGMTCGGSVRVYIKVFDQSQKIIIVGGGHVGLQLYRQALMQSFSVVVVDDRAEFANVERFPDAAEVLVGDVAEVLSAMKIDENCYIAIATRSHECDESALRASVGRGAAYVGMIGSRKKVSGIMKRIKDSGVGEDVLETVFAPMGLAIATIKPEEIALSIISEILLVKNTGSAQHMRDKR